ncbi:MAG: hypothetical protein U9Q98_08585 [Bacteroidota bacterium]|nr:hypothetical protein [Bacteroidota bacterium]
MKIRKLQYNIGYSHILSFKDEYKQIIPKIFSFEKVRYQIENQNTVDENIRIIFKNENIAFFLSKNSLSFVFEGDISKLKKNNIYLDLFWDVYEDIKIFNGYSKTLRHVIVAHAVEIINSSDIDPIEKNTDFLKKNPFGELSDFAVTYEFSKNETDYRFIFGNFGQSDIKKYELTPFNSNYNKDLFDNVGFMCELNALQSEKSVSFTKFKNLLKDSEKIIISFNN